MVAAFAVLEPKRGAGDGGGGNMEFFGNRGVGQTLIEKFGHFPAFVDGLNFFEGQEIAPESGDFGRGFEFKDGVV